MRINGIHSAIGISMYAVLLSLASSVVYADTSKILSTLNDQESVAVTVYNNNLGLVKDTRKITLKVGESELNFEDVSSQIQPQTVHFQSLTSPDAVSVLEQNYEFDLLSPAKLIEKFVGKEIHAIVNNSEVPVTILSAKDGIVYRMGDKIFTESPGRLIFPKLPENLIASPTLVLDLENKNPKPQTIETSYLTHGISWHADYVGTLSKDSKVMNLTGWVTLENHAGATFRNARLKLVAGDVNQVRQEMVRAMEYPTAMKAKAAAPQFTEEGFSEFHLYSLQRPTTLKDQESKQITLLSADRIPVTKEYVYQGQSYYYHSRYPGKISAQKVGTYIWFKNNKDSHLGQPLPKGIVRIYMEDKDDSLQFSGEGEIDHTPKDEKVTLFLGNAFDLTAERKQTDWKKLAENYFESGYEVTLRNHKEEDVTINVVEPMSGDYEIFENTLPFEKIDAFNVRFKVPVTKNGETKLKYRIRVRY